MFSRCEATITVEVTEHISLRVPCMLEAGHDLVGSDHVARVTWSSTDGH